MKLIYLVSKIQNNNPTVPLLFLFLITLLSSPASAQAPPGFGIEINTYAGKILKHSPKLKADVPPLSTALEINFIQQTNGTKDWQQRRHFPLVGVGVTLTNYGNNAVFGKAISIYPNLQIPILHSQKIEWTARVGFGLAYISKRYSRAPEWDTLNTAIGSHFNNFTLLATDVRFHLNNHWDIQVGANFSHISNAAFRVPNLGLNMYGGHVGVRYFPTTSNPFKTLRSLKPLPKRWLLQLRAGISANEYGTADGPLYPVYLFSVYASRRYLSKNKMFAGVDYSFHPGIYAFLRNNEILIGKERENSWKSSVFVGNEFLVGRIGIMLQAGVYLKNAYLRLDPYYQKLGANVYLRQSETGLFKEVTTSVLLKTHRFQAELVEIGLGIGL